MDVTLITRLDDDAYERLVLDNAHPPAREPDVWTALTSPGLISRTYDTLNMLYQRNSSALRKRREERQAFQARCHARGADGKREWFATKQEYDSWRFKAANFNRTVQNALSEVNKARRNINRRTNQRVGQNYRELLREMALAVHRHQAAHARAGTIAEQHDYELWQVLNRLTVPVGPEQEAVTLRTMLDIYWSDVAPADPGEEARARAERSMRSAPAGRSARFSGSPQARHIGNEKDLAG